jgi:hypothetical protein
MAVAEGESIDGDGPEGLVEALFWVSRAAWSRSGLLRRASPDSRGRRDALGARGRHPGLRGRIVSRFPAVGFERAAAPFHGGWH